MRRKSIYCGIPCPLHGMYHQQGWKEVADIKKQYQRLKKDKKHTCAFKYQIHGGRCLSQLTGPKVQAV